MPENLLCRKCDVYVGFGASGVVRQPEGKDPMWLRTHCWVCGRSGPEIAAAQGVDRTAPLDNAKRTVPHGDPLALDTLGTPPSRRFLGAFGADPGLEPDEDPDPFAPEAEYGPPHDPVVQTPIDHYIASYLGEPRGGVVKDVAFNRKSFGPGQPENPDQNNLYVGLDGLKVTLEQDFEDEELQHFFSYAINATRGIDPRNPPEPVDWEEMMRGGLQTALKRINIAFAVYGASRTATHQIVRSTRANFHQQSQRAHYYGDRPSVRMPESWLGKDLINDFSRLAEHAAKTYRKATDAGVSYQDARFALLEGTTNFILCEYSLDEFINVYAYRACSMFQWEIVAIMRLMKAALLYAHPWLAPYVKISCEKTKGSVDKKLDHFSSNPETAEAGAHACTFQGWEEVEGQCDFPWARESNRTFRSERHAIVNKAAPNRDLRRGY